MIALVLLAAVAASEGPIELVCTGGGSANKADVATLNGSDNFGNSGSATVTRRRSEGFADQVDLVIDGNSSRIRLPRIMLPPIHGGDDGWFKLKKVEVNPTLIKASASINFINNPQVYIDRRTGNIRIAGKAGNYSGTCERVEANAGTKF